MTHPDRANSCISPRRFWSEHREATLNWLALGLLLAAWNASDGDAAKQVPAQSILAKGHKSVNVL